MYKPKIWNEGKDATLTRIGVGRLVWSRMGANSTDLRILLRKLFQDSRVKNQRTEIRLVIGIGFGKPVLPEECK
jgi:hypothetical protein